MIRVFGMRYGDFINVMKEIKAGKSLKELNKFRTVDAWQYEEILKII